MQDARQLYETHVKPYLDADREEVTHSPLTRPQCCALIHSAHPKVQVRWESAVKEGISHTFFALSPSEKKWKCHTARALKSQHRVDLASCQHLVGGLSCLLLTGAGGRYHIDWVYPNDLPTRSCFQTLFDGLQALMPWGSLVRPASPGLLQGSPACLPLRDSSSAPSVCGAWEYDCEMAV